MRNGRNRHSGCTDITAALSCFRPLYLHTFVRSSWKTHWFVVALQSVMRIDYGGQARQETTYTLYRFQDTSNTIPCIR